MIEFFRLIWMKKEFEDAVTFLWRFSHGIEKKKKKTLKTVKIRIYWSHDGCYCCQILSQKRQEDKCALYTGR